MPGAPFTLTCDSPDATDRVARTLAQNLAPGDAILLSGDVGAGKTHFTRCAILSLLDQPEDVPSPTYTLVQTYHAKPADIWHADLYRLTDVSEIEELGLDAAFTDAICLIEWPDRLGPLTPAHALSITFTAPGPEDVRTLAFTWTDDKWTAKTESLRHV
ncbi:tRNA (adenosine(37)-N6)-threonylcarbamoyltransferase complex ATPase subunit type 1 TsaE [Roseovarius indicus]|uniref:tRNA (adenosine(37)-N6)-threonylcarbamoyltransferase complex ATPase subunit type 1 TsaE n=1 Tax=Roseovarius indicus TaxID=540747 RepID=UPI0007D9EF6F|nr:tRNA (adenosine(37)-N6)-threonylcarbamoyltransferase complex ATPase subunit type 1 TsaE [Roseovarius indicus]OAO01007.1 tRNA (N6-adenosine(37)-N6)-threonylcarbamoyltransferase complex ATPase TsaE [Roseovarius indicus]